MKRLSEYDNYNYPAGADADPNAPWNQKDDDKRTPGKYTPGNYIAIKAKPGQYLLKDKQSNQLYYTINDAWENYKDGDDIYDELQTYFEIEQEVDKYPDEDGDYASSNISGWKHYIDDDEILEALASYMNDMMQYKRDLDIVADSEKWQDGEGKFLLVTPETINQVINSELNAQARELLGLNQTTK
jgi:hypothetical protein